MTFIRHLPLRTKIIVVMMLTVTTALFLAGATLFLYEVSGSQTKLERDLATIAKIISANSVVAISFNDKKAAGETLAALRAEPHILAACIYGQNGQPFATFQREGYQANFPAAPGPDGSVHADGRLTYFGGIDDERERRRVGTLYFEADFSGLSQRLSSYAKLLALVLATSCIVGFGLSALLQHYISGPIVNLAATMKKVSARRDYSLRAQQESEDEIGQLVGGFNEMLGQIETAHQELESFTYSVSHDLRAPLRALDGFSEMLEEDHADQLPEEGRRHLKTIRRSVRRMSQLIDDLLAFSQLGRQTLRKQAVDTARLVQEVLAELGSPWPDRRVELRVGPLPPCEGDAALLRQVWTNLLSNALKYSSKREQAVVEIGCKEQQGDNVYFVRDNGTGFDMRHVDKLFGVFQRLHQPGDYEGTGVGLAIVHRIVKRHGGRIWADAAVDRGATFYFTLGGKKRF
jgi:signal transduction histidine kinase